MRYTLPLYSVQTVENKSYLQAMFAEHGYDVMFGMITDVRSRPIMCTLNCRTLNWKLNATFVSLSPITTGFRNGRIPENPKVTRQGYGCGPNYVQSMECIIQ